MIRRLLVSTSAAILLAIVLLALTASWIAPYTPRDRDETALLDQPSATHWLGTDENGRDILSLIIYGSRVTVTVGLGTVALCLAVGTLLGLIAGYSRGLVDELLMRATEVVLSFPGILLAILIVFVVQSPGTLTVILALSVTGWAGYARLVRGQVLQARELEFIRASEALGARPARILLRHVLPTILGPIIVQATFGVAGAILAEASLSFLGLGPSEATSWGAMLDQGAVLFIKSPYLAIVPGLAIFSVVLAINFLGDRLRDAFDPTQRHDASSAH
ncbi:MAG: ABC transporter permease [Myxococcales bacterium]|nr:ABC transporter permease [Myxococcales bacterium]